MNRTRLAALLTTVAALAAIAGGTVEDATARVPIRPQHWSRTDRSAARFMVTLLRQKIADQNELAWQQLYPLHKQAAPLEAFVACQSSISFPGTLLSVRALRVFQENIRIAGVATSTKSKAVGVRVSTRVSFSARPLVVEATMHAVAVQGHWTWILSPSQYDAYSTGACP